MTWPSQQTSQQAPRQVSRRVLQRPKAAAAADAVAGNAQSQQPTREPKRAYGKEPLAMNSTCITLFKEAPEANMRRQYSIEVTRDLFGDAVVVCRWGRIGAYGQRREHVCPSDDEAQVLAARLVRKREARGYRRRNLGQRTAVGYAPARGRAETCARRTGAQGFRPVRAPARSRRRRMQENLAQLTFWPKPREASSAPVPRSQLVESAATPCPARYASLLTQLEEQRQARIEQLLRASAVETTRSGKTLQVMRAEQLVAPLGASAAHKRELAIEHGIGVPLRGWPSRPNNRRTSSRRT